MQPTRRMQPEGADSCRAFDLSCHVGSAIRAAMAVTVEAQYAGTPTAPNPDGSYSYRSTSYFLKDDAHHVPGTDAPLHDGRPSGRKPFTVPMPCVVASATKPSQAAKASSPAAAAPPKPTAEPTAEPTASEAAGSSAPEPSAPKAKAKAKAKPKAKPKAKA